MSDTDSIKWLGCIRSHTSPRPQPLPGSRLINCSNLYQDWDKYTRDSTPKPWFSSTGWAAAKWMELMLRRYVDDNIIPPTMEIDGDAIWRKARELFWQEPDGKPLYNNGIRLMEAFFAMLEMSILPTGTRVVRIPPEQPRVSTALRHTPLLVAHRVTNSWHTPGNYGFIKPEEATDNPNGGHPTVMTSVCSDDKGVHLMGLNSWGSSWGFSGFYSMYWDDWGAGLFDGPVTALVPKSWKQNFEWQNYLVGI